MADSELIGHDVGIVASVDPVACEQAAFDLVKAQHGNVDIFKKATRIDGGHILGYAESIGLGRRGYEPCPVVRRKKRDPAARHRCCEPGTVHASRS